MLPWDDDVDVLANYNFAKDIVKTFENMVKFYVNSSTLQQYIYLPTYVDIFFMPPIDWIKSCPYLSLCYQTVLTYLVHKKLWKQQVQVAMGGHFLLPRKQKQGHWVSLL